MSKTFGQRHHTHTHMQNTHTQSEDMKNPLTPFVLKKCSKHPLSNNVRLTRTLAEERQQMKRQLRATHTSHWHCCCHINIGTTPTTPCCCCTTPQNRPLVPNQPQLCGATILMDNPNFRALGWLRECNGFFFFMILCCNNGIFCERCLQNPNSQTKKTSSTH